MDVILTSTGKRDLDTLQDDVKRKILKGIYKISLPVANIKKIKGKSGLKRLRIGDYRVLYKQQGEKVYIVNVRHRKDIYRDI